MLQAALTLCGDMVQSGPQRWLTLCGPSGTGKTRLARSCKRFWASAMGLYREPRTGATLERRSIFLEWGRALSWMVEGDYSFLRDISEAPFVVLDDIGAEYSRLRELSTSKLYEVLCARRYRWTVITANLGMEDISNRLDARIASRLLRDGSQVIELSPSMADFNLRDR